MTSEELELAILRPDEQALAEVLEAHATYDAPDDPIILASTIEMDPYGLEEMFLDSIEY